MSQKTTAEDYFEAIETAGAGTLYYLTEKKGSKDEFVFEPLVIDTKNKDLTLRILKRVMLESNFIAFPGTPEMDKFANSETK
jgi:hypothetical protein